MEDTGTIQGHVRIRSKTQGIALSLGDKITLGMKIISVEGGILLTVIYSAKGALSS